MTHELGQPAMADVAPTGLPIVDELVPPSGDTTPLFIRKKLGTLATGAFLVLAVGLAGSLSGDAIAPVNPYQAAVAASPDCPAELGCIVDLAALGDNGCNYSPVDRDDRVLGITEHITESNLSDAIREFRDTDSCISPNYLVDTDGTVYEIVPPNNVAFAAGNRYFNDRYIQVEHVGFGKNCPVVTPAQLAASEALDRYLIKRYNIKPSASTIIGHDSVPAIDDEHVRGMHTDPYGCWPWKDFLRAVGAPVPATEGADGSVVMIDPQQVSGGANFVQLYDGPSTKDALFGDPYAGAGNALESKASFGRMYAVAARMCGWTGIWYEGRIAWFSDNGGVADSVHAEVVRPKGDTPVAVYGRPAAGAPPLTKYNMQPGQAYVAAEVDDDDGYVEVFWNGRFGFVKAEDVTVSSS